MKLVSNGKILFERWDLAGSQRQEGFPVWAFRPDGTRRLLCYTSKQPVIVKVEPNELVAKEYTSNAGFRYVDILRMGSDGLYWERVSEKEAGELLAGDQVEYQIGYWLATGEWAE